MHPRFLLAIGTFISFAAFMLWRLIATRGQDGAEPYPGTGAPNDPLAGKTEGVRWMEGICFPEEIRADHEFHPG